MELEDDVVGSRSNRAEVLMTREEYGGLFCALKRVRGRCLDNGPVLEVWLEENPQANAETARRVTPGLAAPRPSISGPKPVYPERPFYDARFWEGKE